MALTKVQSEMAGAGQVLQVVSTSAVPSATSTNNTYASIGLSASITPKFATSKILVRAMVVCEGGGTGIQPCATIYRNSTNIAAGSIYLGNIRSSGTYIDGVIPMEVLDSPATTSSTTYAVYGLSGTNAATVYWGAGMTCSIVLMEIAA